VVNPKCVFRWTKVRVAARAVPGTVARLFAPKQPWILDDFNLFLFFRAVGRADGRKRANLRKDENEN